LPFTFATKLDSIPAEIPYLAADFERVAAWRRRLATNEARMRVGLVWSGSLKKRRRANDPIARLSCFAPLAGLPGVSFYSLQKGRLAAEILSPPGGMCLIDHSADLADFADTATLILNLDLVISVDTCVAHLAGALGTPVWTLLPFHTDFRWLLGREDSPWYPSMRLFRQQEPGNWQQVLERVGRELHKLLGL